MLIENQLEAAIGEPLIWHNPPDIKSAKVFFRRGVDIENREGWPAQHEWLRSKLEALHRVFAPVVKQLDVAAV